MTPTRQEKQELLEMSFLGFKGRNIKGKDPFLRKGLLSKLSSPNRQILVVKNDLKMW